MSPARRLLYKRPAGCVLASNTRAATEKNLAFGVSAFAFSARKNRFSMSVLFREYSSKRENTMRLLRPPVFVVKLAVW
jgi:hypothetical protein